MQVRLSNYFLPTLKENPTEAQIVSHRFMLRAGMIRQSAAGIYSWLPLGLRVMQKVEDIVRDEMNRMGALEVLMPTIQPAELWKESGRYDDYGKEMLRITDRHERGMLYGPTNEELICEIFRASVKSYRDIPKQLYQIQWKFRDEVRPRFGVMRGREFLMKDNYSFDMDFDGAKRAYNRNFVAYLRTFHRMGLKAIPMAAESGPIGGNMSHEFIILAETGESEVFCDKGILDLPIPGEDTDYTGELQPIVDEWTGYYAATDEKADQAKHKELGDRLITARGIEVGHIFYFGTKYSEPMNVTVNDADGNAVPVEMGSYGIGVSRLVGAIIEAFHDENGIRWPEPVAPFKAGLINLRAGDEKCDAACEDLLAKLTNAGVEVMYDDRDERAGVKFADMDLIGLPWQVVVGPKGLEKGLLEVKNRMTGEKSELSADDVIQKLAQ